MVRSRGGREGEGGWMKKGRKVGLVGGDGEGKREIWEMNGEGREGVEVC